MTKILKANLADALTENGASELHKQIILNFFVNQWTSAIGQVQGIESNIANLERQKLEWQAVANNLQILIENQTMEIVDESDLDQGPTEGQ